MTVLPSLGFAPYLQESQPFLARCQCIPEGEGWHSARCRPWRPADSGSQFTGGRPRPRRCPACVAEPVRLSLSAWGPSPPRPASSLRRALLAGLLTLPLFCRGRLPRGTRRCPGAEGGCGGPCVGCCLRSCPWFFPLGGGGHGARCAGGEGTWLSTALSLSNSWCLEPLAGPPAAQVTNCPGLSGNEGFPGKQDF